MTALNTADEACDLRAVRVGSVVDIKLVRCLRRASSEKLVQEHGDRWSL